jgi:hypothetical protein
MSIFFWWSIVSSILSLIFLILAVWQFFEGRTQKERNSSQIKVWMQDANGITQSLSRIVRDNLDKRYSSTNDVCNAVWAVHSCAFALYQALYEERCVTEAEYKDRQKEFMDEFKKNQTKTGKELQK